MSTTILPPPAGLRLLRAWRDASGWALDDPLPILALAFKPEEDYATPEFIVPGSAYPLEDSITERSAKALPHEYEHADALLDTEGRVTTAHGQVFDTAEHWLAALIHRDETLAARRSGTPAAPASPSRTRRDEPVLA